MATFSMTNSDSAPGVRDPGEPGDLDQLLAPRARHGSPAGSPCAPPARHLPPFRHCMRLREASTTA